MSYERRADHGQINGRGRTRIRGRGGAGVVVVVQMNHVNRRLIETGQTMGDWSGFPVKGGFQKSAPNNLSKAVSVAEVIVWCPLWPVGRAWTTVVAFVRRVWLSRGFVGSSFALHPRSRRLWVRSFRIASVEPAFSPNRDPASPY